MANALVAGLAGMTSAVSGFQAATAAGFRIGETGGQALLNAIDDMLSEVEQALRKAERISQEPPLGTTPAAEVYKPFLATIATDPVQGFVPAILKFQEDLKRFRVDVEQSMADYRTTDQDSGQGISSAGGSVLTA